MNLFVAIYTSSSYHSPNSLPSSPTPDYPRWRKRAKHTLCPSLPPFSLFLPPLSFLLNTVQLLSEQRRKIGQNYTIPPTLHFTFLFFMCENTGRQTRQAGMAFFWRSFEFFYLAFLFSSNFMVLGLAGGRFSVVWLGYILLLRFCECGWGFRLGVYTWCADAWACGLSDG